MLEMVQLNSDQLLVAAAAGGFLVGFLLTRLLGGSAHRNSKNEDPRNHQIRELEADLRSVNRQLDDANQELEDRKEEFSASVASLQDLRNQLADREAQVEDLDRDLKESVKKTRELRQELQDRATESVREHVRAEEAATELEVARAGSEAVMSEIARLQKEREQLSETMEKLSTQMISDEELFESDS